MSRDEFTEPTKKQLAERAGYRCSFIGCGYPTIGPSDEKNSASSSIGTACHIASAAGGKGARRYVALMTPEQRKHFDNGIWMCETHGKLVDTDEQRFSIEILKKWKSIAEQVARIMIERRCEYNEALNILRFTELAINQIKLDGNGGENEIIGNAINDSCVSVAWGRELANACRDFIIEHIRNAFKYGKATEVSFEAIKNRLIVTDNGNEFNPKSLTKIETQSGGSTSVKELMKANPNVILSTQRENGHNITVIAVLKEQDDIMGITPCSYKLSHRDLINRNVTIKVSETCNEIFIVLPAFTSPSDIGLMHQNFIGLTGEKRPITFIAPQLSELVISMIKRDYPSCHILQVDR